MNNWLPTPRSRLLFVVAVTIGVLFALRFAQGTVWQARIAGFFVGAISLYLFYRFWGHWKALRFQLMRKEMHVIKAWREFFHISPIVKAFHLLALAFCSLSATMGIVIGLNTAMAFLWVAGSILAMAGICEMTTQATRLLKKAWGPILGKVLALSVGAAITVIALSKAKQLVHSLSSIDTKYVAEFTTLVTAFYLPMVFIAAIGVGMAIYASCQLLVLTIFTISNNLMIQSRAVLGESWMEKQQMFWYRISEGKRPSGNILPPRKFLSEFEISMLMSPLSKIILAWMLVQGVDASTTSLPLIAPWLKTQIVAIEYRSGSACKNINKNLGVVYMDDGNVSVARLGKDGYIFNIEACQFQTEVESGSVTQAAK
ncbi:hypothetical protein ACPJXG_28290 [Janthinobacterium sp. NFX145]|uniref:hypothetical protein n=1 Tax=Janthinobacterium sp. NFX145 TaxID=3415602 RepID=UPI003CC54E71